MNDLKKPENLGVAVDHVVVNVLGMLDEARDRYRKLGFHLTARGHHSMGSSNHLAMFTSTYLELLGYEPGADAKRAGLWSSPAGLTGLVFKLPYPDAREHDLGIREIPIDAPKEFNRPVLLPDGPHEARFRVIDVSNRLIPYGRVFFCHHYTPELVWRSEDQHHPNEVTDVAEFVVASDDPVRTAVAYRQMFGDDVVQAQPGGIGISAGAAQILILRHEAVEQRFGISPPHPPGNGDRMVGLAFKTRSIEAVKSCLVQSGHAYISRPAGGVTISPVSQDDPMLSFIE